MGALVPLHSSSEVVGLSLGLVCTEQEPLSRVEIGVLTQNFWMFRVTALKFQLTWLVRNMS